jgi:hypothetical protein
MRQQQAIVPCCSLDTLQCCTEDMDCFLPASKLRCLVATLSFGCVFLWVLSGLYLDRGISDDWSVSPVAHPATAVRSQTRKESVTTSPRRPGHRRTLILHRRLLFEDGGEQRPGNATADELQSPQFESGETGGSGGGDADYDPATARASLHSYVVADETWLKK